MIFSIVLLANFVAWAVLARAAGRGYATKLVDNLRARIEGNVSLPDDATTLDVLRGRLASPVPAEVCVALDLLEKAGAPDIVDRLVEQIAHASADVRAYALERIVELQPRARRGLRALRGTIAADPMASVRRVGARAAAAGGADAIAEVAPYLRDADPAVRAAPR